MREPFEAENRHNPFVAWALAIVFLGLIAAPALTRAPAQQPAAGVVDVGVPGAAVRAPAERGRAWLNAITDDDRFGGAPAEQQREPTASPSDADSAAQPAM